MVTIPKHTSSPAYSKKSQQELNADFVNAVLERSIDTMPDLIRAGADVNTPISFEYERSDGDWDRVVNETATALRYAVKHNDHNMVRMLLELKCDLTNRNQFFCDALVAGQLRVVQEFIKSGVDVNFVNSDGDSPLTIAVDQARAMGEYYNEAQAQGRSKWEQRREIIQALVQAGAHVGHADKYGRTALMLAVKEHDLHTVRLLLQQPSMMQGSYFGFGTAPINYVDREGNTALILAVKSIQYSYYDSYSYHLCVNSQEIFRAIAETPGVNIDIVNKNGETARQLFDELEKRAKRY